MNIKNDWKTFFGFALRVMVVHTLTYFIFGNIMSMVFNYGALFSRAVIRDFMLPIDLHNVLLGLSLQPVRGLIFAVGLWPVRPLLLEKKRGWLILWGLLITVGILSTPAAAPSSIEGMLYTRLPMWYHLTGLPEILLQTLVFSAWLVWWERQSIKDRQPRMKTENPVWAEIVKAIMTACFAFIGYAAGGMLLAAIANARSLKEGTGGIDIEAAGANFKLQFMFVLAFIVNGAAAFGIARYLRANHAALWMIFLLFWCLDALVPWLYQTIVFRGSSIPTVIVLGFFPALIIAASLRLGVQKPAIPELRE